MQFHSLCELERKCKEGALERIKKKLNGARQKKALEGCASSQPLSGKG